jgi:hypothetical protein
LFFSVSARRRFLFPTALPRAVVWFLASTLTLSPFLLSGTVAWEFFGTWDKAIENYFPRYATRARVPGLFPLNVPFLVPIEAFRPGEFYKILQPPAGTSGGKAVLFRPRTWRGTGGTTIPFAGPDYLNVTQVGVCVPFLKVPFDALHGIRMSMLIYRVVCRWLKRSMNTPVEQSPGST